MKYPLAKIHRAFRESSIIRKIQLMQTTRTCGEKATTIDLESRLLVKALWPRFIRAANSEEKVEIYNFV